MPSSVDKVIHAFLQLTVICHCLAAAIVSPVDDVGETPWRPSRNAHLNDSHQAEASDMSSYSLRMLRNVDRGSTSADLPVPLQFLVDLPIHEIAAKG